MTASFRLVTANLWNGRADPDAFADLVQALEADVVAVQELSARQAERLARVLPHGRLDPRPDFRGMGIALRHPGVVRRLALPFRDACIADLQLPGDGVDPIEIINVHIVAPHVPPPWRTFRVRQGQLAALERHLGASPARRRTLVGDLNATPGWPLYQRLAARLSDAAVEAARLNSHRPQETWGPWPGAPRLLRIDHVLTQGLAVHQVRVVPIPRGDHSAVVVDLSPSPPVIQEGSP